MKQLGAALLFAAMIVGFTSCKKAYNCECTFNTGSGDTTIVAATAEFSSQKDADAWCNNNATGGTCEAVKQ